MTAKEYAKQISESMSRASLARTEESRRVGGLKAWRSRRENALKSNRDWNKVERDIAKVK